MTYKTKYKIGDCVYYKDYDGSVRYVLINAIEIQSDKDIKYYCYEIGKSNPPRFSIYEKYLMNERELKKDTLSLYKVLKEKDLENNG